MYVISQKFRILNTPAQTPEMNMAIDEAIMMAHSEGAVPITLRFYTWSPPGVSLGFFQPSKEVNIDACRRRGIGVVRRPTGGKAILHADEVTYSFIARPDTGIFTGTGILETCDEISRGLLLGLRYIGINATSYTGSKTDSDTPICFFVPSYFEIVSRSRKLVGSAQTRKKKTLLQHGSIPMRTDTRLLFETMCLSANGKAVADEMAIFRERATDISQELGYVPPTDMVVDNLVKGFMETFNGTWYADELTHGEKTMALELVKHKYGNPEWTHRL